MKQSFSLPPVLWALAPMLVLAPALSCVTPRIMSALYIICGVLAVAAYMFQHRALPNVHKYWYYAVAAFTGYGALSALWAIDAHDTFSKAFSLGFIFLLGAFLLSILKTLTAAQRQTIGHMLFAGFALGSLIYLSEWAFDFPLYNLVRGGHSTDISDIKQNKAAFLLAIWLFLAFPFMWPNRPRVSKALYLLAIPVLFFVTFQSKSFSAQIILGGAPLLIGALWVLPKRLGIATTLLTCIVITTCMPILALGVYAHTDWLGSGLGNSVLSRVEIWNQAASRASEKPWLGWGLDSARVMPDRDERSVLPDYKGLQKVTHLHPHNAPLQIWFELGGVGIAAVCALFLFFYTRLVQMTNHIAARYGTFMWTTTFLYTLSIWGIWQSWFIATICLIGVMSAWRVGDQDI